MLQKVMFHSLKATGSLVTPVVEIVSTARVDVLLSAGESERNVFDLSVETLVSEDGEFWQVRDTTRLERALGDISPIHLASSAVVTGKYVKARLTLGQSIVSASIVLTCL